MRRMGTRNNGFVGLHEARQQGLASATKYSRKVRANVFAVIVELGLSKRTKGTDYCLSLRVIDHTYNHSGMAVNIFTTNAILLHHHAAPGDIIRLTQVTAEPFNDDLNFVFDKQISSFALYKGKDDNNFDPYQFSSKFIHGAEDQRFIAELRRWFVSFQFHEDPSKFPMVREIKDGFFGLVCKILHCWEVTEDKWGFYVWDSTDAPPNTICSKLEDEINSPLPLTLTPLSLPRELLCTFPDVGTILLIIADPALVKSQLDVLNSGQWVQFVNLRFEVHAGLWCGIFMPQTRLRYTPNKDTLIIKRQRLYEERMSLQSGRVPFSCSLPNSLSVTENTDKSVRPMTLMGILTDSKVTAKYRCLVRVVAAMPCQAEMLPCPDDGIYKLLLTLEDPTARIRAHVFEKDGETFFDGYPSTDVLTRKLNRLLGVAEGDGNMRVQDTPRNPPWLSVCIKAFYKVKTDPWGTRTYRIFDTKIVEEA